MKTLRRRLFLCLAALGLLGRIATTAPAAASSANPVASTSSPDRPKAGSYRIQPTDRLSISVGGEAELNVVGKKVDVNGNINLLYIPDVHVAGLTVREAQAAIENAYRDGRILRNPQVFVNVEEYAAREVTVGGYVKFPGKVQILPETIMTLKDAISKCGGLGETANGKAVRITRTLPDGSLKLFDKLDVESALLSKPGAKAGDANFILEPGDNVYIPERII
ncbi:MAG: polysaccharide export protein [Verrucomicrobia bacterium]|nr:polysaccharide export protein [Verrucomicrobiota bacterium]